MDAFEAHAQSVRSGVNDHSGLSSFTSFLKDYVDDLHHTAEETRLFATMSSNGFPLETRRIASYIPWPRSVSPSRPRRR